MLCLAFGVLAGCATREPPPAGTAVAGVPMQCVPFARAVSGVQLQGDAADWWPQAEGRYRRTRTPAVGSVLVFRRTPRLPHGHVAVVSGVLGERRILLTHANWVRHQISEDVPAIDVSPANDWSLVRVWWPPANRLGATEYAAAGFVAADAPPARDEIKANARAVIRIAVRD